MELNKVLFQGGESRWNPGEAVDFMVAYVADPDDPDTVIELYAEMENPTWDEDADAFADESYTYDDLKAEIISQTRENGIDPESLVF